VSVEILALVVLLPALAAFGLTIWALVDLLRRPESDWAETGQDRLVWLLVVIFVGILGPILYLAICRPKFPAVGMGEPVSPSAAQSI
jgi:hypothetical protein